MIEPTETETKERLDEFVDAMRSIAAEASDSPETLKDAPLTRPVRRLDEVKAAKQPVVRYAFDDASARDRIESRMTVAVAHELVELAHDLARAVSEHDVDRLEQLLAAEFTLQGAAGQLDRDAFLEAAAGPYEIDEFTYEEIDPEVYGNTAVLVSRYNQVARLDGRDLTHRMHVTDIWTRRDAPLADRPPARDRGGLDDQRHATLARRARGRARRRARGAAATRGRSS